MKQSKTITGCHLRILQVQQSLIPLISLLEDLASISLLNTLRRNHYSHVSESVERQQLPREVLPYLIPLPSAHSGSHRHSGTQEDFIKTLGKQIGWKLVPNVFTWPHMSDSGFSRGIQSVWLPYDSTSYMYTVYFFAEV